MSSFPSFGSSLSSTYRPPQWAKSSKVLITVPAGAASNTPNGSSVQQGVAQDGTNAFVISTTVTAPVSYVFDAVLALEHDQTLTKTRHPVQTGSAVSSHAYIEPAQLVLYVLMSDVVGSYTNGVNQTIAPYIQAWTGNPSKSVAAYQQMLALQAIRTPITVTTRLRTYYNMLITKVSPREDDKTVTGARFRLEFEQIFVASTQTNPVSARPNDTDSTGLGAVNPQAVPATVNTQFNIDDSTGDADMPNESMLNWLSANPAGVDVPGAGNYSSVNTNSLRQLPSPA